MNYHNLLNKSSLVCILLSYVLTWTHIGAQDLQSNNSIELYQNNESFVCFFSAVDVSNYLIIGRVTINSDLRSVGFQKRTVNSESFEYTCIINFLNSCNASQFQQCYCTSTNESNVYDIVWNKTLKEEDSDGKALAVMFIYGQEKITSNEVPVDKVNFQLEINDQPVNTDKCLQTITSNKLKIQYNATSSKGFPVTISILDEDIITELKENVVEMYILREFEKKVETNLIFKVNVCSWDFINITCSFKNAIHTSSYNEVSVIISVVVSVTATFAGAAIYVIIKKRKTKSKRHHMNLRERMVLQETASPIKQQEGRLNIFKEYHENEYTDFELKIVSLLLIGKHGNGKRATGNSILGRKSFTSTSNPFESKQEIKQRTTTIDERLVQVVVGPSFSRNVQMLINLFKQSLDLCPERFDTVLLIFRYGSRYTSKDDKRLELLKLILGERFVSNRCIIVITGGDNFKHESKDDSIINWCMNTSGPFRKLVQDCNKRVVLFDNKTVDQATRSKQVNNLLDLIDKLRPY